MEALVVLIIGSVLIVILRKMPSKDLPKFGLPKPILGIFSRLKKAQEKHQEEKEDLYDEGDYRKKKELLEKADALLKNNKFKEAEDFYISVLKIDQKDILSYKGLGQICFKKKNYKDALEIFQKLVELAPADSSNYCNLGMCYFQKKNFKKAQESYKKALDIEKKPAYYKNLGIALFNSKKYQEALEALEEFIKIEKNNDKDVITLMMKIFPKIKNKKKIKSVLEFLLKLDPENAILKREMSRVK